MRSRFWTARIGPLMLASALVPSLVATLIVAAPRQPSGGGGGVAQLDEPSATSTVAIPNRSTPPARTPVKEPAAERAETPTLPCTPLRGQRAHAVTAPAVKVEGLLSERGEHTGRRVTLRARQGAEVSVTLPGESFVAQPSGDWLVYGTTGRRESEVRAVDLETGCDVRLTRVDGIARGAILDPAGAALYVHAVDARSRRDLGVTRIDLATGEGSAALARFMPPDGFGPVYATSLSWTMDGASLAVQSCGGETCHTRLLDTANRAVSTYATPHGGLVGVSATDLIAFAEGHDRPAPLLAIDRADGDVRILVEEAYAAELSGTATSPVLRIETPAGWQEVTP